jgi:hypothetical protein
MLTYQVRRRQIKIRGTSTVLFPAEAEINFHLLPKQAFGVSTEDGRTLTQSVSGGNRTEIDPVAAIGLERSCAPAWHIEGSGPSTKHAAF